MPELKTSVQITDKNRGWIAVDLDGTLAFYDQWRGAGHIGYPIKPMVERVKNWLAEGFEVRILTARCCSRDPKENAEFYSAIRGFCLENFGQELRVTNEKDFGMVELWDDRAVQVITNTGERVGNVNPLPHPK